MLDEGRLALQYLRPSNLHGGESRCLSNERNRGQLSVRRGEALRLQGHSLAFLRRGILCRSLALSGFIAAVLIGSREHEELLARNASAPHHRDEQE